MVSLRYSGEQNSIGLSRKKCSSCVAGSQLSGCSFCRSIA